MSSIAGDVIGGFNTFIEEQKKNGTDARVTLVQFDSQDPQEVLASGVPIAELVPLTRDNFIPRGGTPLLDATGKLIGRATLDEQDRAAKNQEKEDVVFVTITDGEENQSTEFSLERVKNLITHCEEREWMFVFLSAALDAYQDPDRMGMKMGNIQSFKSDGKGANLAFSSLSKNMSSMRDKRRRGEDVKNADFFEDKEAEDDRKQDEA
jgi:antitoxin (DNA-binding transcriptional repressor) of toxin-antitoxin stability system